MLNTHACPIEWCSKFAINFSAITTKIPCSMCAHYDTRPECLHKQTPENTRAWFCDCFGQETITQTTAQMRKPQHCMRCWGSLWTQPLHRYFCTWHWGPFSVTKFGKSSGVHHWMGRQLGSSKIVVSNLVNSILFCIVNKRGSKGIEVRSWWQNVARSVVSSIEWRDSFYHSKYLCS